MGCFNATGFFSKLPLQSGDDMVLIFCADLTRTSHKDSLPIYVGEFYVPLNAPIFCKYNDYGAVFEDTVVRDANAEFFEKSIGVNCEELCNMIHEYGSINLGEVAKIRAEMLEEDGDTDFNKKRIAELDKFEKILHTFFDKSYDMWRDKMGLVWIMEHKDVYEQIANIGEGAVMSDWRDDTDVCRKRCEMAFRAVKDYPQLDERFNLLNHSRTISAIERMVTEKIYNSVEEVSNEEEKKMYEEVHEKYGEEYASFFGSSCILESSYMRECFPTYESILGSKEWEKYKDNFIQFFRFTRVMASQHRIFELSTYGSQSVYTKPLEKISEIIADKTKKMCEEYRELYEDED